MLGLELGSGPLEEKQVPLTTEPFSPQPVSSLSAARSLKTSRGFLFCHSSSGTSSKLILPAVLQLPPLNPGFLVVDDFRATEIFESSCLSFSGSFCSCCAESSSWGWFGCVSSVPRFLDCVVPSVEMVEVLGTESGSRGPWSALSEELGLLCSLSCSLSRLRSSAMTWHTEGLASQTLFSL